MHVSRLPYEYLGSAKLFTVFMSILFGTTDFACNAADACVVLGREPFGAVRVFWSSGRSKAHCCTILPASWNYDRTAHGNGRRIEFNLDRRQWQEIQGVVANNRQLFRTKCSTSGNQSDDSGCADE